MNDICIIIPCYNEYERFPRNEFMDYYSSSEVSFCFVNDGSSDNTSQLLGEISEGKDRIITLDYEKNRGKAEAIRFAVNYLLNSTSFSYIGYFDADLATPLWEIDNMLSELNGFKMILGSRLKRLGARIERNPLRHYVGRVFATLASSILKLPVYDTQCGAKIMSKDFAAIAFEERFLTSWLFDVEILYRLKNYNLDNIGFIKELPLKQWIEKGGSKIKFIHMIKVPLQLLKLYFHYRK